MESHLYWWYLSNNLVWPSSAMFLTAAIDVHVHFPTVGMYQTINASFFTVISQFSRYVYMNNLLIFHENQYFFCTTFHNSHFLHIPQYQCLHIFLFQPVHICIN
jgi:hypothetical protein